MRQAEQIICFDLHVDGFNAQDLRLKLQFLHFLSCFLGIFIILSFQIILSISVSELSCKTSNLFLFSNICKGFCSRLCFFFFFFESFEITFWDFIDFFSQKAEFRLFSKLHISCSKTSNLLKVSKTLIDDSRYFLNLLT